VLDSSGRLSPLPRARSGRRGFVLVYRQILRQSLPAHPFHLTIVCLLPPAPPRAIQYPDGNGVNQVIK